MSYFKRVLVNTLTFIALSVFLPDYLFVHSFWAAVLASVVLSLLNGLVKPVIQLLSLPLTLITFGLFSFVINAVMLEMTSYFLGSGRFGFSSFGSALFVAVIMSLVNSVILDHEYRKGYGG